MSADVRVDADFTDRWGFDFISITAIYEAGRTLGPAKKENRERTEALAGSRHVRCADIDIERESTSARKAERNFWKGIFDAFMGVGYRKRPLRVKSIFAAPRKTAVSHTGTAL
jgi:hypothetical protein